MDVRISKRFNTRSGTQKPAPFQYFNAERPKTFDHFNDFNLTIEKAPPFQEMRVGFFHESAGGKSTADKADKTEAVKS